MSKYTSLLFGPDTYHHIGPFRLPVYKDLVPGEAKKLEAVSRQFTAATYKSIELAKRVAKDRDITVKEAIELLSNANDPSNEGLVMEYVAELEELENFQMGAMAQKIAFVTVLVQFRASAEIDGAWQPLSDWTEEDTEHMPPQYLNALFDFLTWERDGWPTEGKTQDQSESEPPRKPSKSAD
jgi:hypothetical protein